MHGKQIHKESTRRKRHDDHLQLPGCPIANVLIGSCISVEINVPKVNLACNLLYVCLEWSRYVGTSLVGRHVVVKVGVAPFGLGGNWGTCEGPVASWREGGEGAGAFCRAAAAHTRLTALAGLTLKLIMSIHQLSECPWRQK